MNNKRMPSNVVIASTVLVLITIVACSRSDDKSGKHVYPVKVEKKRGLIDGTGCVVVEPKYKISSDVDFIERKTECILASDDEWLYATPQGIRRLKPKVSLEELIYFTHVGDSLYQFTLRTTEHPSRRIAFDIRGIWKPTDKSVVPGWWASEELVCIRKQEKMGVADRTGKVLIAPQFDECFPFHDGLALVKLDDLYGYIDLTGEYLVPPKYSDATQKFVDGMAVAIPADDSDEVITIDRTGTRIATWPLPRPGRTFFRFEKLTGGLILYQDPDSQKYGWVDLRGQWRIPAQYAKAWRFRSGWAAVKYSDAKVGVLHFIDTQGATQLVVPNVDGAGSFVGDLAYVVVEQSTKDGVIRREGYINRTGKWVWTAESNQR